MIGAARTGRYDRFSAAIHWLVTALVGVQLVLGVTFHMMPYGPVRNGWFAWHRTIGPVILVLVVTGWVRRIRRPPPPLPATFPRWQARAAGVVHAALAALLIALPLTGWVAVSAWKDPGGSGSFIGGIAMPLIPGVSYDAGNFAESLHKLFVTLFSWLLALHVAAALWHQRRSAALRGRMPPLPQGQVAASSSASSP
ncbi:MAG: cytochrome b/b6 domain-containing protein [Pseudomonadota bacterium]